jgi:hypothetical protein
VRRLSKLIGMSLPVAACFSPHYPEGSACTDTCPGDLSCVDGLCVSGGGGVEIDAGIDAAPKCPPDYTRNATTKSWYRVAGAPASQAAAVADCGDDGANAHLAIPDDFTENSVIDALAVDDTWLGFTDAVMEGTWVTVLGATQTYFRWAVTQPNGGTAESCAFMADARWQDTDCTIARLYVCECR